MLLRLGLSNKLRNLGRLREPLMLLLEGLQIAMEVHQVFPFRRLKRNGRLRDLSQRLSISVLNLGREGVQELVFRVLERTKLATLRNSEELSLRATLGLLPHADKKAVCFEGFLRLSHVKRPRSVGPRRELDLAESA